MSTVSKRPVSWFNARNVTIFVVVTMTVGVVWSLIAQWIPPSPRQVAFDSYSGTVIGFRGIYDLLEELGPRVERNLQPPPAWLDGQHRVLLLQPSMLALELEKEYLGHIQAWVRAGGELVIVSEDIGPDAIENSFPLLSDARKSRYLEFFGDERLLAGFGIDELEVAGREDDVNVFDADSVDVRHIVTNLYADYRRLGQSYAVTSSGTLAAIGNVAPTVELPGDSLRYFTGKSIEKASGSVFVTRNHGEAKAIALEFAVGAGHVTLVAEPALFTNASLQHDRNAVAAYHLAAGSRGLPVLIDEYYHGSLAGRNALQVLTMYPFPVIALCVLAALGLWAWSNVVRFGPAEQAAGVNRRSILEYVDAMARLYRRGKKEAFVLKTLRDGTLDRLRQDLGMPAGIPEAPLIQRLERRDPESALELLDLLERIDAALDLDSADRQITKQRLLELEGMLETCRWKNSRAGARTTA